MVSGRPWGLVCSGGFLLGHRAVAISSADTGNKGKQLIQESRRGKLVTKKCALCIIYIGKWKRKKEKNNLKTCKGKGMSKLKCRKSSSLTGTVLSLQCKLRGGSWKGGSIAQPSSEGRDGGMRGAVEGRRVQGRKEGAKTESQNRTSARRVLEDPLDQTAFPAAFIFKTASSFTSFTRRGCPVMTTHGTPQRTPRHGQLKYFMVADAHPGHSAMYTVISKEQRNSYIWAELVWE